QLDLRAALRPSTTDLQRAATALPALFAVEYALAQLLGSWGVRPRALIGHSLGEYVAACLAGVFRLEDALALVALRGRLFDELPPGGMLSLPLPEAATRAILPPELDLAAVNAPEQCVVSGPREALAAFGATLSARGIESRRLHIDVAAHSSMVTPILDRFRRFVATFTLSAPTLPVMSNLTGAWLTAAEATSPDYWAAHLRETVRFDDGLAGLMREPGQLLLEIGPGRTLHSLVKLSPAGARPSAVVTTVRHPQDEQSDQAYLMTALGRLWIAGAEIDWAALHAPARPRRVSLPTYPFERERYWIDPLATAPMTESATTMTAPRALHERPRALAEAAPIRSEVERAIVAIWQQLLGIRDIGVDDDFFELGGSSLVMTQVLNQLQRTFDVPLTIRELFLHPRVAALATLIEARRPAPQADAPPAPLTPRLRAAFPGERLTLLSDALRALEPLAGDVAAARVGQLLELPLTAAELEAPSLQTLARRLLARLGLSGMAADDAPALPDVSALSDDEVQRLLSQALRDEEVAL
ncbi:MAG TPA: acyltransferase domain-containing protein, partial [Polyangia bacterium]|nr:acyltransferase domain-containing protein [Polyangia bacterium]